MNDVVTADQFVSGISGEKNTGSMGELDAIVDAKRAQVRRLVRQLNKMHARAKGRAEVEKAERAARKLADEVWNARAICQMAEIAPNHYACRPDEHVEFLAACAVAIYGGAK